MTSFYHFVDVEIDGDTVTKIVRAVDGSKKPVTKKVLLDANGYRLAEGATPIWKETKLYGVQNFTTLFGATIIS